MPSELVVPAFALVLAANAILIALAIRTFASERDARGGKTPDVASGESTADAPGSVDEAAPVTAEAVRTAAAPEPLAAQVVEPAAVPTAEPTAGPSTTDARKARRSRSSRATSAASGRRQRFALPQLDEDHDRFNRSISTFLSGGKRSDGE